MSLPFSIWMLAACLASFVGQRVILPAHRPAAMHYGKIDQRRGGHETRDFMGRRSSKHHSFALKRRHRCRCHRQQRRRHRLWTSWVVTTLRAPLSLWINVFGRRVGQHRSLSLEDVI